MAASFCYFATSIPDTPFQKSHGYSACLSVSSIQSSIFISSFSESGLLLQNISGFTSRTFAIAFSRSFLGMRCPVSYWAKPLFPLSPRTAAHPADIPLGLASVRLPQTGDGCGLFGGFVGVLFQKGKNGGTVKIISQLSGGNGFCPVWGKVGQSPSALFDGYSML